MPQLGDNIFVYLVKVGVFIEHYVVLANKARIAQAKTFTCRKTYYMALIEHKK